MVDYPAELPTPEREDYGLSHISPFTRSEMVTGRARQRRTYTSVPSMASVSFIFATPGEARLFEAWFREVVNDGADWFNCKLLSPVGLESYECRFAEMYQGPMLVGNQSWRVTAILEIKERPLIAKGWATNYPQAIVNSDIIDIAANQEWPEE